MRYWINLLCWVGLIAFLGVISAKADDYSFKFGVGQNEGEYTRAIKIFSLRAEGRVLGPIYDAREAGFWADTLGDGRRNAAFGKYQLGIKPGPDVGIYGKAFLGAQLQSSIDTRLGGYFQFSEDFGIGIRDEISFIEIGYGHVSSAGIYEPNRGRDFLTLSLGLRF